jgi:hypothetical protein
VSIKYTPLRFGENDFSPSQEIYHAVHLHMQTMSDGSLVEQARESAFGRSEKEALNALGLRMIRDIVQGSRKVVYRYRLASSQEHA